MPTESAAQALAILRDGSRWQWHVIPLLALVLYVYASEIERRNWNVVFAGLAVWGMDWFNEIWNGLVLHFSRYAPVWGAPGGTAYLILVGLNIGICLMFAIAGVVVAKTLPADPRARILGVPNRWAVAVAAAMFCVLVEVFLRETRRTPGTAHGLRDRCRSSRAPLAFVTPSIPASLMLLFPAGSTFRALGRDTSSALGAAFANAHRPSGAPHRGRTPRLERRDCANPPAAAIAV